MPATLSTRTHGTYLTRPPTQPEKIRHAALALFLSAVMVSGCQSVDKSASAKKVADPPTGVPADILTIWQPKVYMLPDPSRNGEAGPGLVVRVFLEGRGKNQPPMCCDGELTVDLYDDHAPGGKGPVMIERWVIDKGNLKKMIDKDDIGWGYTVFLPSQRCVPGVTHIHLNAMFKPETGNPLIAPSTTLHLSYPENWRPSPAVGVAYQGNQPDAGAVLPPYSQGQPQATTGRPLGQAQPVTPVTFQGQSVLMTPAALVHQGQAQQQTAPRAVDPRQSLTTLPVQPDHAAQVHPQLEVYPPQ